jgi:deoxyribodipyrimidine photo-lyase
MKIDPKRIYRWNTVPEGAGPVVYWMQRDQRVNDNWALLYAREKADALNQPLAVVFCLASQFINAPASHFSFMKAGLVEVEQELRRKNIPFFLLHGSADQVLPAFLQSNHAGALITDFNPLKIVVEWKRRILKEVQIPVFEADAHNILPCREISPKAEFSAMHLRNRIHKRLHEFLTDFPGLSPARPENLQHQWTSVHRMDVSSFARTGSVFGYTPGAGTAGRHLEEFLSAGLESYDISRNDPNLNGQSGLSPYLHLGQISAQRVAFEVMKRGGSQKAREAFLEELIVRRELADNFCHYNPDYDSTAGFHPWAKATLDAHRGDQRQHLYDFIHFRDGETHDPLWNAAQRELVQEGKMHGFMRMYWAKKILEWTNSPEEAMEVAIGLNDGFSLDGRDPNGYAGIAWSIGGVHDRAWGERPVFGKIRYMNYQGCSRKFDVAQYIRKTEKIIL